MPSETLVRILRAKSPFSEEQISAMSDAAGWAWVYASSSAKKQDRGPQVCFTGFGAVDKAELTRHANEAGLEVVGSVTKGLAILCVGANAGAVKLASATRQGVRIMSQEEFMAFLSTGELPG